MPDSERSQSWWSTLPGILTAVAGVVSAVAALVVALNQSGVFDRKETPPAKSVKSQEPPPAPPKALLEPARPPADAPKAERPKSPPRGDAGAPSPPALVAVPDVLRLSLDGASSRLGEAQLRVGRKSFYTLGRYPPGTVYQQKTAAGARVSPGTAIELSIEREKLPGVQSSGLIHLSPGYVWDLDGERSNPRQDVDIRFGAASATERYLEPRNGAAIGVVGRTPVDRDRCATASLSESRVILQIGVYLCVRTNRGRYSVLRVDDLSSELTISFDTWQSAAAAPAPRADVPRVQLADRDSYHFLSGARSSVLGGDFYLTIDANGAAMFYANNRGQRGLVDLGDSGRVPMSGIRVPESGYYQFGVPVVAGHTYASLARAGEEGHFVVFRVDQVTRDSVTLSYVYR